MTERKIYFGSVGPFLYDDADDIDDGDGDFSGEKHAAIATSGVMRQDGTPIEGNDNVRLQDVSVGTGLTVEDFRYAFMLSAS